LFDFFFFNEKVLDVIKQLWVDTRTYGGGKLEFLADIYSLLTIGQSIVFVGRKDDADDVHRTLHQAGFTCSVLHGDVEPAQRDAVMDAFRRGESNVLIATNVLARGVDVCVLEKNIFLTWNMRNSDAPFLLCTGGQCVFGDQL
jgi:superfamily II DNA/RNA helicase